MPASSFPHEQSNPDDVLVGPTLKVYKALLTAKEPLSARGIQKLLHMSTPSLAVFHLEKLEHSGLVSKSEDGYYSVSRLYLRHYFRLRRFLIPRFVFHSVLASFFVFGWIFLILSIYYAPNSLLSKSTSLSLAVLVSMG